MDKVIEILLSNTAICVYEGTILGFLIVRYFKLREEKKRTMEMTTLQKEKAREEQLDQMLKNKLYQGSAEKAGKNNVPYEVNFHEETVKNEGSKDNIAIQIVEKGKLSTRKYVIFVSDMITLGKGEQNTVVINDLNIAKEQCRIFKHNEELYIQNLDDSYSVNIQRKRNVMQLASGAVKLMDGDMIGLGETTLEIYFI